MVAYLVPMVSMAAVAMRPINIGWVWSAIKDWDKVKRNAANRFPRGNLLQKMESRYKRQLVSIPMFVFLEMLLSSVKLKVILLWLSWDLETKYWPTPNRKDTITPESSVGSTKR